MTIAERGRAEESLATAEVFSWSELPELFAAEDLFEGVAATVRGVPGRRIDVVAVDDDDDFDDEDWDDEDDDEDEDDDWDEEDDE